jgi:hypothetical protein
MNRRNPFFFVNQAVLDPFEVFSVSYPRLEKMFSEVMKARIVLYSIYW